MSTYEPHFHCIFSAIIKSDIKRHPKKLLKPEIRQAELKTLTPIKKVLLCRFSSNTLTGKLYEDRYN